MNPVAVAKGAETIVKHRRGLTQIAALTGIAALVGGGMMLRSCEEKPLVENTHTIEIDKAPQVEIRKIVGIQALCLVEQETVVPVIAKDVSNMQINVPVPFFGSRTPVDWDYATRVSEKHVGSKTELCALAENTEITTTFVDNVPTELNVNIRELTPRGGIESSMTQEMPVKYAKIDNLPFVKYDNGDVMDLAEVIGESLAEKYTCNNFGFQAAQIEGHSYFSNLGKTIGNIPPENIYVNFAAPPLNTEGRPEGTVSNQDLSQLIGVEVPDSVNVEVGVWDCNAVTINSSGQIQPTWQWEPTS